MHEIVQFNPFKFTNNKAKHLLKVVFNTFYLKPYFDNKPTPTDRFLLFYSTFYPLCLKPSSSFTIFFFSTGGGMEAHYVSINPFVGN